MAGYTRYGNRTTIRPKIKPVKIFGNKGLVLNPEASKEWDAQLGLDDNNKKMSSSSDLSTSSSNSSNKGFFGGSRKKLVNKDT